MANKKQLDDLTVQKIAAGLSPLDAAECAQRQLDHDDEVAAAADAAAAAAAKAAKKNGKKAEAPTPSDDAAPGA